ncbi:hypothetical protein BDV98DRAFT_507549 [Pterulicium gracile]|uniref:Uncharacterized protein n=1 Tax=Pterulicium gracile TaxID=1884261 RepID=A0A5C3QIQ1_9AGAR|nr:hypothetical protein BDV98DRAFT_507549 [Pterula gracilis]
MDLAQRDVYSPHITSPGHKSVWTVGSKQSVTWDVSDAPPKDKITNSKGQIMLGYKDKDGETQHLDFAHPIAKGFDIRDGQHTIVVPDVPDRKENYFIVLMGDSGNKSPSFKIIQGSNSVGGFGQPGGPEQGHQGGGQASTSGQGGAQKGGLLPGKLGGILPGV